MLGPASPLYPGSRQRCQSGSALTLDDHGSIRENRFAPSIIDRTLHQFVGNDTVAGFPPYVIFN